MPLLNNLFVKYKEKRIKLSLHKNMKAVYATLPEVQKDVIARYATSMWRQTIRSSNLI